MWRAYDRGERVFCGIKIPDSLEKNQKLNDLLITPTTKGIMKGIPGVPEEDDTNLTKKQIVANYDMFGFRNLADVDKYEHLLVRGFDLISDDLNEIKEIFVDTKFEFGYAKDEDGVEQMIYIDEIGTPDSSRIWDAESYQKGEIVEKSKEEFRGYLLNMDKDLMTNKSRSKEKKDFASTYEVPYEVFMNVSKTYTNIAEKIIGSELPKVENPREEILESLSEFGIII
jgi:phosphoribosylaminoimidazole-succinocarboxamide synthase